MHNNRVCVITTAHGPFDDRIFHKECRSLAKEGFKVTLIAPHHRNETVNGVSIVALPKAKNRFHRMAGLSLKALYLALREKAEVYHLHDPELLFVGLFIKILKRKKVIYDVHEDYGKKILSKEWLKKGARTVLSGMIAAMEIVASHIFDFILAADSNIRGKFSLKKSEVIANYPPLKFMTEKQEHKNDTLKVIYIGGIASSRGSNIMFQTMECLKDDNIELHLLGKFDNELEIQDFKKLKRVIYHGFVPWREVNKYLMDADIGLLLLQPTPSYLNLTGEGVVKLFEYMTMKLPVVISDFPMLNRLITKLGCGICVDPTDPVKIAGTIRYLRDHPELREKMGEKGRQAVIEKYNWENESKKLIDVYTKVIGSSNGKHAKT